MCYPSKRRMGGRAPLVINTILWNDDRTFHIAKHGIEIHEVEEAVYDDPYGTTKKMASSQRDSTQYIYRLLGRSTNGRYIAFFYIYHGRGVAYPVTARDMTGAERRSYSAFKR
jgi:uncharacterized DUF497 family protein